jgi:hypothetical protein
MSIGSPVYPQEFSSCPRDEADRLCAAKRCSRPTSVDNVADDR